MFFYVFQNEVKRHNFFASINWDDLEQKKISPPFNPNVVGSCSSNHITHKLIIANDAENLINILLSHRILRMISLTLTQSLRTKLSPTLCATPPSIPLSTPVLWRLMMPSWGSLTPHLPMTHSCERTGILENLVCCVKPCTFASFVIIV